MLRLRLRMPLWAAAAIPVAAYALRSLMRGDARPDIPGDLVVFGLVAIALAIAARHGSAADRRRDDLDAEMPKGDEEQRDDG